MAKNHFHSFYIKNMLCRCCIKQMENILQKNNYTIEFIQLGKISVTKSNFNEKKNLINFLLRMVLVL